MSGMADRHAGVSADRFAWITQPRKERQEMVTVKPISDFSMELFHLDGKVALITGGNTGLGQAYAVGFAKAGADLFIITYDDDWRETRALIEKEGRRVSFEQSDLTSKGAVGQVVESCLEQYGRIDILVNNAGIVNNNYILEYEYSDWQKVLDIHVNVAFSLSKEVAKVMIRQGGGKIINIGSMNSFVNNAIDVAYVAAKHAVLGLTRAFAVELARYKIQVNALCPGYILTSSGIGFFGENREFAGSIPAKRFGDPFDCVGAAIFLASDASDYVSGIALPIDGGFLVRGPMVDE
jgi:2-dehydro-3-deoxy-D-gluconate 5-dehydrogenase